MSYRRRVKYSIKESTSWPNIKCYGNVKHIKSGKTNMPLSFKTFSDENITYNNSFNNTHSRAREVLLYFD